MRYSTSPMVGVAAGPKPARSSIALIARIVAGAVAFRVVSAVLAFLCNLVFPLYQPEQFPSVFGSMRAFWDPFTRYDGGWYYQIARNGYQFVVGGPSVGVGKPGKIAYFPVYPLLMRYASRLFGTLAGATSTSAASSCRGSRSCWRWCCCSSSPCSTWTRSRRSDPCTWRRSFRSRSSTASSTRRRRSCCSCWRPSTCSGSGGGFSAACSAASRRRRE